VAFVKDENLFYAKLDSAVSVNKAGLCLKLAADGELELAGIGDRAIGVAAMTTEDPLDPGTYKKGVRIAVIRRGIVKLQLISTNAAISPGDRLKTAGSGLVDKFTDGDTTTAWPTTYAATTAETITDEIISVIREVKQIVGIALESVSANSGGTVKALLSISER